jgi:methylated-DNA-[protein]-cysteine S-methyltransferase
MGKTMTFHTYIDTPLGSLQLVSDGQALTGLFFPEPQTGFFTGPGWVRDDSAAPFPLVKAELDDYFQGKLTRFTVPLAPSGTAFQLSVWRALQDIPYGQTISYRELARRVGCPKGMRAAGHANGRNPIAILIPCHRVVGSDGNLTGYGGGIDKKRALLLLERGD